MDLNTIVIAAVNAARADGINATIELDPEAFSPLHCADVWTCPECGGINVQAWLWRYLPESLQDESGIGNETGSCFETVCGCCHASMVPPDSILLSECFTH